MPAELALADQLGRHALALFALALPLWLAGISAAWWLLWRGPAARWSGQQTAGALLLMRLGLGFAVVLAGAALFAEIAEEIGAGEEFGALDEAFSAAIRQTVSLPTLRVFAALTRLGDVATLTVLCVAVAGLLLWRGRRWLALAWVAAVAGNGLLNRGLKSLFERVRPVHDHGLVNEAGWSFPSGHSSGSMVAYGMLAYVLLLILPRRWHLPVLLFAAALVFGVAWSRVFLQVHYASDVMAGLASGAAWLAACIAACEYGFHQRRGLPTAP